MGTVNVLVVDDDPRIRELVATYFRAEGYEVRTAEDGQGALDAAHEAPPAIVILDVMLPDVDGIEVLRRIRRESDVPVILLTARAEETDTLIGLAVGADDYVTKPFSPRELVARAKAVLRRGGRGGHIEEDAARFAGLTIDPARRRVERNGQEVVLSALEFDLLAALAAAPGRVFTRRQLIDRVWGWDFFGDERVVDVHIRSLRRALGDDASAPEVIGTVRGVGYRFLVGPA